MKLTGLSTSLGRWLDGSGPASDVVLSTRVRLARNLSGVPFTHRAREEQLVMVYSSVLSAVRKTPALTQSLALEMRELTPLDRQFLVERHLISNDLADNGKLRGLLVLPDESISAMVNEEDHLRLQALASGFQLRAAWESVNAIDDELAQDLDYAFSDELGYLTACPTNVGTGMRASVLIHLPSLSQIQGNFFQISNQTTLGQNERETIDSLERVTKQIIDSEQRARDELLKDARVQIEDKIWRAYGTLRHSRVISSQEVVNLSSAVRFGVALRIEGLASVQTLNELLVRSQPAHLQVRAGRELEQRERNILRAEYIRGLLGEGGSVPVSRSN
ncbi:MAG: ATP--guanido phosphotransferase [Candidatus Eisenbacteria bacterium]|uniref:ATP--guanido phosphotransferase n=1 Tax=Eiseniibacteriota bacterium TaxID=2212470 RepID=A0A538TBG2_UNCEI|nr:MAG: ATP--guanido phosphotransferase [Candidatus Eisenbacteria bacterium]